MSDVEGKNGKGPEEEEVPTVSFPGSGKKAIGQVGPYKLLSVLGEGGCGMVYLAERERPVKRRVALKIIKPGMDSKQVIARFEAEEQALALLDHPNVAQVYEAGMTEAGQSYFAMEYVKGVPITEHCDRQKLSVKERLKLFLQICDAVGHAHQKGIIHRDIKPSNILVLFERQKALPKVIDFGIAKAISQPLTDRTLFTEQGQLLGTPEYMSPEQAEMTAQDIDTRSDIYSLGVVLYELLTGTLPFDRKTLEKAGFGEIQRIIREQDPPRPSTRLSSLGEEATKVAQSRRTEVASLTKQLHKELEWIPLKAMRKDRTRRYRSASELADDVQNYLKGAPLIAGPESAVYRVRKFVRRNRATVTAAAFVVAAIVVGFVVSTVMYFQAEQAREKEAVARTRAEQAEGVAQEQRQRAEANFQMAQDAVDEMTRVAEKSLANVPGAERVQRELLENAQVFYASFAEENRDNPGVREEIARAYERVGHIHIELGNFVQAREALGQAIALLEVLAANFPSVPEYRVELAECWGAHSYTFWWTREREGRVQGKRKQVAILEELVVDFPTVPAYLELLALAHTGLGGSLAVRVVRSQQTESEKHHRKSLAIWQKLHTDFPEMPKDLEGLSESHLWLGAVLLKTGPLWEAEHELRLALELREQLFFEDPNSPWQRGRLAHIKSYVGELLLKKGKIKDAEKEFRPAIAIREKLLDEFPSHIEHRRRLGWLLYHLSKALVDSGRSEEAEGTLRQAIAHREKLAADFPNVVGYRWDLSWDLVTLGEVLSRAGRLDEALQTYRRAIEIREELTAVFPDEQQYREELADVYTGLGDVLKESGRLDEAEEAYRRAEAINEAE